MAPVTGSATARLLLYSLLMVIFTAYVIISAHISNGCVSALRIYDRDSLFSIRESMFYTWGRYKQAFPPPFIIDPDSPEYLLLCWAPGKVRRKSRKRGSESRSSEGALQHTWALPSSAMENAQGVCTGFLSSMCVTARPRCRLLGPQWRSWSLHRAGVVVIGFHRLHALLCLHRICSHGPAGAHVIAGHAFDQSRCAPRTLPP